MVTANGLPVSPKPFPLSVLAALLGGEKGGRRDGPSHATIGIETIGAAASSN